MLYKVLGRWRRVEGELTKAGEAERTRREGRRCGELEQRFAVVDLDALKASLSRTDASDSHKIRLEGPSESSKPKHESFVV